MKPSSNAATSQTIPSDVQEFSQKLIETTSDNYSPRLTDEILKHSIPSDAKLIPTSSYLHKKDYKDLKRALKDFDSSDATHAVIPMLIDADSRYAAIHLKKDGYSFSASFIDPRGGEEKSFTTQVSEYIFGKGTNSGITSLSPIPPHVLKALKSELNIDQEDIAVTTNKLQYSKMNGYGIRESDNNSGPIVVNTLASLANGDIAVAGTRLVAKDGDNSLLKDSSADSSVGEILRISHAGILADFYKDQAAALDRMNLEEAKKEASAQKKGNLRSSDNQYNYRANSEVQNQIGVGLNPARIIELIAKAVAFRAILSATSDNNQQGNVGSSLSVGEENLGKQNSDSLTITEGSQNRRILQTGHRPTRKPTSFPTGQPTSNPTAPSVQPSSSPSGQPSRQPTGQPTTQPTGQPSTPTAQPSKQPTGQPSLQPSTNTSQPTSQPTSNVTDSTGSTNSKDETYIPHVPNQAVYAVGAVVAAGIVVGAGVAIHKATKKAPHAARAKSIPTDFSRF